VGENALLNTGIEKTECEENRKPASDSKIEAMPGMELEVAMIEALMDEFGEEVMEGSGDFDREAFMNLVLSDPDKMEDAQAIIERFYPSAEDKNSKK
jgi:hypothetical protein